MTALITLTHANAIQKLQRNRCSPTSRGWATGEHAVFGNVTVLADGRILALGTKIWLVAADGSSVQDLGDVGNYPAHPIVVGDRLYSHGIGPWWTQLPPTSP